ncbi:unnamed protein product (macronuclear) [Paramecium tetraurelia]|uniref:Uncharacterized protein n=1 Tax=Paramecium tetraurelia TaxID=5888 RepID=A0DE99_PARTE|nr:uncharacterized protein GSPATT00039450001 [Paramecium tetraurelia]CAK81366.1 unnamed protein product [Paramecium tetraurelia]|eukprot:XP_001448763.1 hypothetical protein (macronuclear) [Paramecium tetraurelia strain d4-2]
MKKINQPQQKTKRKIQKVKLHKKKKEKISIINQQSDNLGQILERNKNQEKNLKKKRKLINSNLNSEKSLINRGLSLMRKGKFEESIIQFDEAIKLNPKNDEAQALHQLNKTNSKKVYNQQIKPLNQTLKMMKLIIKKAFNQIILGAALFHLNKQKEAELQFQKAISLNPKNEFAQFNMANLLRECDRHKEAIEYYNHVIQINPSDIEYYVEKAFCLQALKKYHNAIECFNQALSLNPDEELTQTLLMNKGTIKCERQVFHQVAFNNLRRNQTATKKLSRYNPKHKEAQKLINNFKLKINNSNKAYDNGTQQNKKQKIKQLAKQKI